MKNAILTGIAGIALATATAFGGYAIGHNASENAPTASKELHMTLSAPITLTANLETGEWECSNDFGTIHTITAYVANMNNLQVVSERSASGGMVTINPEAEMRFCHGYAG